MLDLYGLPTKGLRIKVDSITTTGLSASGWLKRDKLLFVLIRIVGGGGGGSDIPGESGGGSGAYCEKWYRGDELNSVEDVTVGAGGAVVGNGGDSLFKDMAAGGGKDGRFGGGVGGTASGGDLNIAGNKEAISGSGGPSVFFNFGTGGPQGGGGSPGVFIAWNFIAGE